MLTILLFILVAGHSLTPALTAVTEKQKKESLIVFPESVQEFDKNNTDADVPISCKGQTFCTIKPVDYPEKKFNEMFKGYHAFPQPKLVFDPLKNKQGKQNGGNDCESEESYEPLYKVKEIGQEPWRTVVQAPAHKFVQRVRLEKCLNTDSSCFTLFSPASGYGTRCKQIYGVWEVLVAKGDNQTELVKAKLPICCSCYYSKTPLILYRLHANKE